MMLLQIMLRLQAQDRPEIPPQDRLPGQPLPGIIDYIDLMKVNTHVTALLLLLAGGVTKAMNDGMNLTAKLARF